MWVAKIRFSSEGTLIGSKTSKYEVDIFAFPLSYYYAKDWVILQCAGTILGKEVDKKAFVKELKKEKRVIDFELSGDFFIAIIKEPIYTKIVYNKDIIHIAPALISDQGYEMITIGSFEKSALVKVAELLKERYSGKLLSIQQRRIKSISIVKAHPELTDKQKLALQLAIKNSYYAYPRKISLPQLAKLAGISYSTFQAHLRKAEQKLIPFFFES